MSHSLVTQLHFARSEFVRGLGGVSEADGVRRVGRMNSISWIVGHLASQELYLWVELGQDEHPFPGLHELVGWGSRPATPPLADMWASWRAITQAGDCYLENLTAGDMVGPLPHAQQPGREPVGTCILRCAYHYWFHLGEAHAIRQQLGHSDVPEFVGNMSPVRF